jgi:hypothetical protein
MLASAASKPVRSLIPSRYWKASRVHWILTQRRMGDDASRLRWYRLHGLSSEVNAAVDGGLIQGLAGIIVPTFPQRSPPWLFTKAARGGAA